MGEDRTGPHVIDDDKNEHSIRLVIISSILSSVYFLSDFSVFLTIYFMILSPNFEYLPFSMKLVVFFLFILHH
jgi:hypothetical protein